MSVRLHLVPAADEFATDVIDGELDYTREIEAPWLLPPVPRSTLARRVTRSPFAEDVKRYGWLVGLILAGLLCLVLTRGEVVTWGGLETIPAVAR